MLKGQASSALLESYEAERRPLAIRNTRYARGFADSLGIEPAPEIEEDTPSGADARRRASEHFERHGRAEFNIPGITFGGRYDGSPAIVSDGSAPPPDTPNVYVPSACPGGRPPHVWLAGGQSLFDRFGFEWTLVRFSKTSGARCARGMARRGLQLRIVDLESEEARALYEADLALVRPDQIVAWRGNDDADADAVLARLTAHG